MALLECNTALSPELVPARQRQGEGGEPASVDALAERRLRADLQVGRSEEHTSELQSLMRISYAVFCLKKKTYKPKKQNKTHLHINLLIDNETIAYMFITPMYTLRTHQN